MTKQTVIFSAVSALCAALITAAAIQGVPLLSHGRDAKGNATESPAAAYSGKGDVSVRFGAEDSPQLSKWWNGRLVASCPVGYHFNVESVPGSEHADAHQQQATCAPNPAE